MRKFFVQLVMALCWIALQACTGMGNLPGENPATPTPPVPVFGDFILNVATADAPAGSGAPQLKGFGTSIATSPKRLSLENGGLIVQETRNTIAEISFESSASDESEVDFPGTYVIELVQNGVVVNEEFPDFGVTQIPFGNYNEYKMKFVRLESGDIPPQLLPDPLVSQLLLDQSFVIEGNFLERPGQDLDGNGQINYIPFQILSDNEVEIEVTSPNFFPVTQDKINYFFIAFVLQDWFTNLLPLFQQLQPGDLTGGVAVVSNDNSNPRLIAILNQFEDNTERACKSAPSDSEEFNQDDVDEDSESNPL